MDNFRQPAAALASLIDQYESGRIAPAEMMCDRHDPADVAFAIVDPSGGTVELTFGELREQSEMLAAGLSERGIAVGDRIGTLMSKGSDFLVVALAIYRLGAVQVPLFTAFAPPAIGMRLRASNARMVICTEDQQHKLAPGPDMPDDAAWQTVVAGAAHNPSHLRLEDIPLPRTVPAAQLGPDDPIIHIFTSGTTGKPKGVLVPAKALNCFNAYMEFGLAVRRDDVYWNAADPGWAYGLYYGVLGPLLIGVRSVWLRGGFSAALTLRVLADQRVTNFAAAPTVYRALRALAVPAPELRVRHASSAGEPLTPDVNAWAEAALGVVVHDHYGQTETGMLINNHHHRDLAAPLRTGSMGRAMTGWQAVVLDPDADREVGPGEVGRIAISLNASPLAWFDGYVGEAAKSAEKFAGDGRWYLTGDLGTVDEDGYFHFVSRDDDVIIMAGYRIGPFDIESVLASHPLVREVAVTAAPDEIRGETLEAFVVLNEGGQPGDVIASELQDLVKQGYGAHAYPRRVHFVEALPKTPSGKIQRFLLRQETAVRR